VNAAGIWLRSEAARQADRGFLWLVVAFAGGIALFFAWKTDPSVWMTPGICAAGAVVWFTGRRVFGVQNSVSGAQLLGFALIAAGMGHGAAQVRTWDVATPLLVRDTRPVMLTGLVVDTAPGPVVNRMVLEPESVPGLPRADTPKRLRINIPRGHGLPRVGDAVQVRAVVGPAAVPVIPDGFQFQRFLYFSRIGGTGYTLGRWETVSAESELTWTAAFLSTIEAWRSAIGRNVEAVVTGAAGAVATALINGEQGVIPDEVQEAYRVAGIAHLLSISGVHMTLLAGVVFFVVRRLLALVPAVALRIDTKKTAAWAGLATTAFYLVISGMSVPAVRAFLMIAVVLFAILLDRAALSLRTIAFAALLIMALFPEAVFGASFQMSFLAVLALVALYEHAWLKVKWRTASGELMLLRAAMVYVAALAVTDVAAGGATSLFAAYHFNRLPTYSVIANFAAVPLTGLWIMPAGILGLLLMPFGWHEIPLRVMGAGVAALNDVARVAASWPGAQVHVPPMATWAMVLAAFGIVFVCLWRGRLRWLGFAAALPAFIQPYVSRAPDVLVDDTARVYAVSDANRNLVLRPGRTGRFVREVWADRYGISKMSWPQNGSGDGSLGLACDGDGCVLSRAGQKVLLAFTPTALAEDCNAADFIISATASYDICRRARGIDIVDLRRNGAYAVWLTEEGARVRSVKESTGERVWMRGESGLSEDENEAENSQN